MIIISPKNISNLRGKDPVTLKCECCGEEFERDKRIVLSVMSGSTKNKLKYCSRPCSSIMQKTAREASCSQCNTKFIRIPSKLGKSTNDYCSCSCAAIWNNSNRKPGTNTGPKRKVFTYCQKCNIPISNNKTFCSEHKQSLLNKTLKESENMPSNRHRSIRDNARRLAKVKGLLNSCKICGYSKHVVTCHIKGIATFDEDILVSTINELSNLVGLCQNHHWEMDHDLLSNEDKAALDKP